MIALVAATWSCALGPDRNITTTLNYGAVTVFVTGVRPVPRGPDSVLVSLDSAIQGDYLHFIASVGDSAKFPAVVAGTHETWLLGVRSGCAVQARTSTDTATTVGVRRTVIVEDGYQTNVFYTLTCPP